MLYKDDPQFIPGIFGGVADGGAFQQGNQTALAQQSALAYTHVFSPTLINVARAGLNYLHTTAFRPSAFNSSDIPSNLRHSGYSTGQENGGLPAFGINGLSTLGSNAFLPSDEVSSTIQLTDDLTKIYGKHTFKMGFEWQHVKFSTLQPPWSHGEFDYNGNYTEIPGNGDQGNTGRAAFLLTPVVATPGVGTVDYLGGSTNIYASNISLTDNGKNYYGTYFNDDWKVSPEVDREPWAALGFLRAWCLTTTAPKRTSFLAEHPPAVQCTYSREERTLPVSQPAFTDLLTADGIALDITNKYGKGLGNSQKANFAPRLGFAYQATPKLVVRGGFGMFYNGFENRGYSPNLGENYPFQFNFNYGQPNDWTPRTFPGCAAAGPGGTATFETGFACTPLDPTTGPREWSGFARDSVQLSNPLHDERELHAAISTHADDDGAGGIRDLSGASFGGFPWVQQSERHPANRYTTHKQRGAQWRPG